MNWLTRLKNKTSPQTAAHCYDSLMPSPAAHSTLAAGTLRGFVLTGGASRRMGADKALLPWRGGTLLDWVARQVLEATGSVTLVGAPGRYAARGYEAIGEQHAGAGPLSGLEAALRQSASDLNLIVACDMPLVSAAALLSLCTAALESGADVCAAATAGVAEPLCAVYHRRLLGTIETALKEGRLSVRQLLAQWKVRLWEPPDPGWTANINQPGEWQALLAEGN